MANNYPGVSAFNQKYGLGGANIGINVTANTAQAQAALGALQSNINSFTRNTGNAMAKAGKGFGAFDIHLRRINANFVAAGFAVVGLTNKIADFVERGAKMEVFQARMQGISGSLLGAQEDMAKVISVAESMPFSLESITRGFIKLKAAGIEPITGKNGEGPLMSLLDAMAAFGGNSEQLDRAVTALSQMAGKGVVSMEELRQQLGEAVPTALRIAAREMNMTVGKFVKLVSQGKIEWSEFQAVFFSGLTKNYGGQGQKLLNTFKGSLEQMNTQFDLLAKAVLIDTGVMRYFTSAVQLANERIKKFRMFMQTKAGQDWVDSLWKGFKDVANYAARAITPVKSLVDIIGSLSSIVAGATGGMPAEVVGGGLLGFALFGRAGIVPGVFLGAFGETIAGAIAKVKDFLQVTDSAFTAYGGALSSAAIGGYLGYRIAGPKGALVGAVAGALADVASNLESWIGETNAHLLKLGAATTVPLAKSIFTGASDEEVLQEGRENYEKWFGTLKKLNEENPVNLKVDLEESGLAAIAGGAVDDFTKQIEERAVRITESVQQMSSASRDLLSSISKEAMAAADQATVSFSEFGEKTYANVEVAQSKVSEYIKTLDSEIANAQDKLSGYSDGFTRALEAGNDGSEWEAKMKNMENYVTRLVAAKETAVTQLSQLEGKMAGEGLVSGNVVADIARVTTAIEEFAARVPTTFSSQQSLIAESAKYAEQLQVLRTAVEELAVPEEDRIKLLQAMDVAQQELAGGQELIIDKFSGSGAAIEENNRKVQAVSESISQLNEKAQKMIFGESMTGEAERMGEAGNNIRQILDDIQQKILEIQDLKSRGLISAETADASIANLNRIAASVESNKSRIINAASNIEQAWQSMGKEIYSAIENSLGDAIYGLVTKTKSMKDVLLDLWRSVTRAVSNYLAKVIMAGLFGGGSGGGGGLFGSLFGGGGGGMNTGGALKFAGGGSFAMDGRTGFDNNYVGMRVSRGERVTVETAAQQRANGRSGGGGDIHIHSVDADSVRRLFMREGAALQQSINHRMRLNNQ